MVHGENLIAAKMNPDLTVCHMDPGLDCPQVGSDVKTVSNGFRLRVGFIISLGLDQSLEFD